MSEVYDPKAWFSSVKRSLEEAARSKSMSPSQPKKFTINIEIHRADQVEKTVLYVIRLCSALMDFVKVSSAPISDLTLDDFNLVLSVSDQSILPMVDVYVPLLRLLGVGHLTAKFVPAAAS